MMTETNLDPSQALKDTENALRDFIAAVLHKRLGEKWYEACGVTPERLERWKERKEIEKKRQAFGTIEERLIYYADFYDMKTILQKNWDSDFSQAFGDWKTMDVFLTELERLRDPNAHSRELMPYQKHLIVGIAGQIRTRVVRYRSKRETSEDYYPRIESARDDLGNTFVPQESRLGAVDTKMALRVGDKIQFVVTATDPLGDTLEYAMRDGICGWQWSKSNAMEVQIREEHVGTNFNVTIYVKSPRKFHARGEYDDRVSFWYEVLPPA